VLTGLQGSQSIVAKPASGYKFASNQTSVTYPFDLGTYSTCVVTVTDPTVANPTCTGPNSPDNGSISIKTSTFVEYTLTPPGVDAVSQDFPSSATDGTTETIDGLAPGIYTVTATGLDGHTINGQTLFVFPVTETTLTAPGCTTTAPNVSFTLASCTPTVHLTGQFNAADTEVQGTINLPVDNDVVYAIDGTIVAGGADYSEPDGPHTVTATLTLAEQDLGITIVPGTGYVVSDSGHVATWAVTFSAGCTLPTLAALTWEYSSTDAVCTASGAKGTITATEDAGQLGTIAFTLTNNSTHVVSGPYVGTTVFSKLTPGSYTLDAVPTDTAHFGLAGNTGSTPNVDISPIVIAKAATLCGSTSLAFTGGTIAWAGFVLAGGMLFLGFAFLLIRRRGNRTAE
jgi:hypothetical protein